jgi:hypothetical protein
VDDLPAWRARPARSARGHGAIQLLLAMVIAAALAWVVFDAASAAFPSSPCSFRASTQYTSVRPLQRFRHRIIPGQPAPLSCPRQPMDPFHQNLALIGR